VVCSRGLDKLGIGRDTPDPVGGEIERGADGEPTGLLIERAWSQAEALSLEGYTDPDRWGELVVARAHTLLRDGITAIHDAACPPEAEALYRDLIRAGRLPLSVLAMPHPTASLINDHRTRWGDGPKTGEGDERYRTGATKFFADGGTAIALDVQMNGHPLRMGITMDDLEECLVDATRQGFRVGVHAMGNRGVQLAIDAFAAARRAMPDEDHRFRLEHVGVASADQCKAMADLGAIGVVQPGFVDHVSDQSQGARFDHHHWLPFRTLLDAGVMLAGSSDDPCAPYAPIWCSARGATRTSIAGNIIEPDEAVDFDVWLRAYTSGAAYAGGQEHERGSIASGLRADLVVLDGELDPHDPPRVVETWVAGERVFAETTE
jgi:predicted amidohydrolase YtcJ